MSFLRRLLPHRHRWTYGGKPVERIADIPADALFYRLDCECGRSIDGAALRARVGDDPPGWLRRSLGFVR